MKRFYTYSDAGEPAVRLNRHDPARPFAVITFGDDRDFTSKDLAYCRRVALARTSAAELQHDPDREAGQ